MSRTLLLLALLLLSVTPAWAQPPAQEPQTVPITYLPGSEDGMIQGHLFWVPVEVNGKPCKFILDTGIGLNLISSKLAKELGCPDTGEVFRGQRMSGQTVEVPLSWYSNLTVGGRQRSFVTCGVLDFNGFLPDTPAFQGIEGFLSLRFFQHQPFTLDYGRNELVLETPESLESRLKTGQVVPLDFDDDQGVTLTVFAPLVLPGVGTAKVEIDTGSDSLILNKRYMSMMDIDPDGPKVKTVRAKDETNHPFERYFASGVTTTAEFEGVQKSNRPIGRCMFQEIIYDGLVGDDFLRGHIVTFDLAHSRMFLNEPDHSQK